MVDEILRALRIKELNPLQKIAVPKILEGKNVIVVAPTGFGKTYCAVIPIFKKILEEGGRAIYITPLRALNRDIFFRIVKAGKELGIYVDIRHGDTPPSLRRKQAENPPDFLITTPETFQILFFGKKLRKILNDVRFVVVDEVHELISSKRGVQLSLGLERLREYTKFQRILLSATVENPRRCAEYFMGGENFEVIDFKGERKYDVEVLYPEITEEDKKLSRILLISEKMAWGIRKIKEILEKEKGSVIIFTNTRETAEFLASKLKRAFPEMRVEIHHSSLSREVREEHEKLLREGKIKALVSTSSMELGIDIGHIDLIVQFMSPRQVKRLKQRVGRSKHYIGGIARGKIITFDFDDYCESLAIVSLEKEGYLEKEEVFEKAYDVLAHQIAGILIDKGSSNLKDIYNIVRRCKFYENLKIEELIDVLRFMEEIGIIRIKNNKIYQGKRCKLYYIENVSMIPDEKNFFVIDEETNMRIGILHEDFVLRNCEVGRIIVIKGECWKIRRIEGNKIFVTQEEGVGEIPEWEGELIPVYFEVSQKATEIKRKLFEKFYKSGWIPEKDKIVIESDGDITVVNLPFGNKVNEVFARILASRIGRKYGIDVRISVDPYRVILEFGNAKEVENLLKEGFSEEDLIDGIKRTKIFLSRLFHVGKRFGVFSKEMEFDITIVKKALQTLEGTPVEKEAIREIMISKMDVEKAKEIFERIRKGEIKIVHYKGISEMTRECSIEMGDLYISRADYLRLVKERIENTELVVYCPNEEKILYKRKVKEIDCFKCPRCGAALSFLKEKELEKKDKIIFNRDLVQSFGKNALYVIASILPDNLKVEVLMKYSNDFERFIKEIAKLERKVIRTVLRE